MNEGRVVLDGTPHDVFNERGLLSRLGIRYPQQRPQGDWAALSAELQTRQNARGPLLALQSVGAGYDSRTVLEDLDLEIYPGEFVALVGENGAGKTTLARLIAGLLKPRSGRVVWEKSAAHLPLGRRVGLLFQNPLDQLFCDSVEQEVSFGPGNFQMPAGDHLEKVLEAAGLDALRSRNPYALSAGQQQRVALASILSLQPALLVLDEPTMGQDWGSLSRMMDFLVELNGGGQSILLITHDYKLVCRYAERVLVLEDGHVSARTIDVGSNVELKEEREKKREVLGT
jgi:energy-coupling factor transporter ATP-binding protein EcfA2